MLFTLLVMGISAQDRTITGIVMDGDLDAFIKAFLMEFAGSEQQ